VPCKEKGGEGVAAVIREVCARGGRQRALFMLDRKKGEGGEKERYYNILEKKK